MKFLIIFVVALLTQVYGQGQSQQQNPGAQLQSGGQILTPILWRQCAQEHRVEQDELLRFKNRDLSNSRETVQCFTNCLFEKMGIIHNGEIAEQKVIQAISQNMQPDQLNTKISTCHAQARGQQKCENAYKFYVCLLNSTGNTDLFRFGEMA